MNIRETFDDIRYRVVDGIKNVKNGTLNWVARNGEAIKDTAPIWVPLTYFFVRRGVRAHDRKKDWRETECSHWDPRAGETFYSKKPLNNRQKARMDKECKEKGINKGEWLRRNHLG